MAMASGHRSDRERRIVIVPIGCRCSKFPFIPLHSSSTSDLLRFQIPSIPPLPCYYPIPVDRLFGSRQRWRPRLPISFLPFRLVFDPIFHSSFDAFSIHSHPIHQPQIKSLTCSSLGLLLLLLLLYFRTLSISSTPYNDIRGHT